MAVLRLIKESELRRRDVIGSGAFGTVYKVRAVRRLFLARWATPLGDSLYAQLNAVGNQTPLEIVA